MNFKLILIIQLAVYNTSAEKIQDKDDKSINNRIINGFTPGPNDNPHVALLRIQFSSNSGGSCTGSLISPEWVLTAGHCAKNASIIQVQVGIFNRTEGAAQTIIVSGSDNIIVHPHFVNNKVVGVINDIALLRLNPKANITLINIKPIPLACPNDGNFSGETGRACGWGITNDTSTSITTVLQCVDMPVITNFECTIRWLGYIPPTNVCTRNVDFHTACSGDSGGSLAVFYGSSGKQKLIGATSFGSYPCATTAPNVFTRITSYYAWINKITGISCDSSS